MSPQTSSPVRIPYYSPITPLNYMYTRSYFSIFLSLDSSPCMRKRTLSNVDSHQPKATPAYSHTLPKEKNHIWDGLEELSLALPQKLFQTIIMNTLLLVWKASTTHVCLILLLYKIRTRIPVACDKKNLEPCFG